MAANIARDDSLGLWVAIPKKPSTVSDVYQNRSDGLTLPSREVEAKPDDYEDWRRMEQLEMVLCCCKR